MTNKKQSDNRAQFSLSKVKVLKDKVVVDYHMDRTIGSEFFRDTLKYESSRFPHPDLKTPLMTLKPMMAHIFRLDTAKNVASITDKAQRESAIEAVTDNMNSLEITGIGLSGSNDNRAVVITAMLRSPSGMTMAINSHLIRLGIETPAYPFVEELNEIAKKLEEESYLYVFESKMAQQTIAFEDETK